MLRREGEALADGRGIQQSPQVRQPLTRCILAHRHGLALRAAHTLAGRLAQAGEQHLLAGPRRPAHHEPMARRLDLLGRHEAPGGEAGLEGRVGVQLRDRPPGSSPPPARAQRPRASARAAAAWAPPSPATGPREAYARKPRQRRTAAGQDERPGPVGEGREAGPPALLDRVRRPHRALQNVAARHVDGQGVPARRRDIRDRV